jgi:hypothetical protein
MKTRITLLAIFISAFYTGFSQQVPNESFETWTNEFTPTGWVGVEDVVGNLIPFQNSVFTFRDTTTYTVGTTSIKLVADTIPGAAFFGVVPGTISLGTGTFNGTTPSFAGIPFIYRPDSISFDYMLTSPGSDTAGLNVQLNYNGTSLLSVNGSKGLQRPIYLDSSWSHLSFALTPYYVSSQYPDSILIQFASSIRPLRGTTLHLDNVQLIYVTAPVSVAALGSTNVCPGDSVVLQAYTGSSTGFHYQWIYNGLLVEGGIFSTLTAKDTGTFSVAVDSGGLGATSQTIVITDTGCPPATSINNIATATFEVYPNPASNILNIRANVNMRGYSVQIYDVLGQLILGQVLESGNNTVNVAKLANGIYVARITDEVTNMVTQKKFNVLK